MLFLNNSFQIPRTHSEPCPGAVCSALSVSASSVSCISPQCCCGCTSPVSLLPGWSAWKTGCVYTHHKQAFSGWFWEWKWRPRQKFSLEVTPGKRVMPGCSHSRFATEEFVFK